ncbi:hypothetical protein [Streptomyces sp. NPDC048825]|uniref:hypothetical protein n=1 Tax=Streptomyces sp. NPDC048825 TaxID=3365592 RepID=UPI00371DC1E9
MGDGGRPRHRPGSPGRVRKWAGHLVGVDLDDVHAQVHDAVDSIAERLDRDAGNGREWRRPHETSPIAETT